MKKSEKKEAFKEIFYGLDDSYSKYICITPKEAEVRIKEADAWYKMLNAYYMEGYQEGYDDGIEDREYEED